MAKFEIDEAQRYFSFLVAAAQRGETVVITQNDVPIAELSRYFDVENTSPEVSD